MNFKRKLLLLLISFSFIIPINAYAYTKYLIPGGENIGINLQADGVFVVGFYQVHNKDLAKKAGFKIGDRIIKINNYRINGLADLIEQINSDEENLQVSFEIIRDNHVKKLILNLPKEENGTYKTGLFVKDTITGIGTITYINPEDNTYGALGHEIQETTAGLNFTARSGKIFQSKITSVTKASVGKPGEKNAKLEFNKVYGNIISNDETGIYGNLYEKISDEEKIPVASIDEVTIGNAEIITVLEGNKKEKFNVEILSIDENNPTKNFLIKINDDKLLEKTGGIVKGMSGSPIIQNGKLVGAVTHTIVDNPMKGFGISIIKMLESRE